MIDQPTTDTRNGQRVPDGVAVAALLAAAIGLLALGVAAFVAEASKPAADWLHALGKLWMPAAQGIGPYSGKETVAAVAWLASWGALHAWLRKREVRVGLGLIGFLAGATLATLLVWPPFWHLLLGHGLGAM